MDADSFLSRLQNVKRLPDGTYTARCLAHDSKSGSTLAIKIEDDKILITDRGGCSTEDALAAYNMTTADLYLDKARNGYSRPRIVAVYEYTDSNGKPLFEVVRREPKDFRQRRPDGEGHWVWGTLDGEYAQSRDGDWYRPNDRTPATATRRRFPAVPLVLYRLPRVAAAAEAGETVFVVEGEKDVESLEALGFVATTSPRGAGKWRDEYSRTLIGARVVVVPDNDEPGRKHAEQVCSSIRKLGGECTIIDLAADWKEMPAGADISDWLATGPPADYLLALVEEAARSEAQAEKKASDGRFIDWSSFWSRDHAEADWVFDDVLARSRGHAIYASHKEGKSLFLLYLAAKLATSEEKIVSVYLDYEMSEADVKERLQDMGYGPASDLSRLRYWLLPTIPGLDTEEGSAELMAALDEVQAEYPDHHLIVTIDTVSRAVVGEENPSDTIRDFYRHTGIQLKRRGITWARLDHAGKDITKGQRGSSAKGDDVDVVWRLTKTNNGVSLNRDFARMPWVPDKVIFTINEEPLSYRRTAHDWPAGTADLANLLSRLQVPLEATVKDAKAALSAVNEGRRTAFVSAALRWRRMRDAGLLEGMVRDERNVCNMQQAGKSLLRETRRETPGNAETHSGAFPGNAGKRARFEAGNARETPGNAFTGTEGPHPTPVGGVVPSPASDDGIPF